MADQSVVSCCRAGNLRRQGARVSRADGGSSRRWCARRVTARISSFRMDSTRAAITTSASGAMPMRRRRRKAIPTSTASGATSRSTASTPLVDVAWAVEVGLAAAGPWQERRVARTAADGRARAHNAKRLVQRRRQRVAPTAVSVPAAASGPLDIRRRPGQRRSGCRPRREDRRERALAAFSISRSAPRSKRRTAESSPAATSRTRPTA